MKNTFRIILLIIFSLLGFTLQAQDCNEGKHSVNIHDSWLSCEVATNPNATRGVSHWVMYDLGYTYAIDGSHFWNYNTLNATQNGMRNIAIDVSNNGSDWTAVGNFELNEATGTNHYTGESGLAFGGVEARYILITALDTWGGDCAGLSEVRLDIGGTVPIDEISDESFDLSVLPNPATETIRVETNWNATELIILNATGQEITRQPVVENLDISYLPSGIYYLKAINDKKEFKTVRFVKQGL